VESSLHVEAVIVDWLKAYMVQVLLATLTIIWTDKVAALAFKLEEMD